MLVPVKRYACDPRVAIAESMFRTNRRSEAAVGFYSRVIFPRLCDFGLSSLVVTEERRKLLEAATGNILEIGFGTGLNLPCYPAGVRRLTTVDPNLGMSKLAERRIKQSGIAVDQRIQKGEPLPFGDNTFDCVVSTFTLCSIREVERALAELHRVLRPGGRFLFLEHGLSPDPGVQKWQRRLNWIQMRIGDGCRLDRNMQAIVASQPFSSLAAEAYYLAKMPKTHSYLYRGMALK
jgi:ubiquinone/menaquinone biosynthesis C-methylase UbiE